MSSLQEIGPEVTRASMENEKELPNRGVANMFANAQAATGGHPHPEHVFD